MATNFPASLDALTNPTSSDTLASPDHAGQHANANDAIEALQAKVGITSSADATSLDYIVARKANLASPTFTGTPTLPSGTIATTQTAGNNSTAVATTAYVDSTLFTGYDYEVHVSQVDGNDTTGNGDLLKPVATLTKALQIVVAAVGVSDRRTIILHPGTYTENVTVSSGTYIIAQGAQGANTVIAGTVTVNATCRLTGIKMTNLVVNTTAAVYLYNSTVDTQMTVTNTGYLEVTGCSLQCPSGVSITGATQTGVVFNATTIWGLVVNNASAVVIVRNSPQVATATLTAGTLALSNSLVFPANDTANAITSSAGSVITLSNLNILIPTGTNVARVSLSGFYSIIDVVFDKANSSLIGTSGTGGSTNSVDYFQYINADRLFLQDQIVFEGSTDDAYETTLTLANPSADRTITLPDATGTVALTASPTFTGTPTLPTGTIATTQSANNNSTAIATTAYVDTADALKANLASPTFTGTPSLPTGTTGTTQTANNNSTALATTAYVDTADALKANLASPTFTGTPTLPTGTIATTQTAGNNSTALATTAYVDAADALKANLASPTFTGTPSLPTGTTATTQTALDSTTKLATTAFVTTADALKADIASPTFTGTVTIPAGASISGFAPLASPALTGTPTAPTATAATNTTQVATTAFVRGEIATLVGTAGATLDTLGEIATALNNDANLSGTLTTAIGLKAPLASPTFTGTVTLPTGTVGVTQSASNNSTALATTAYVDTADALKANLASPTFTGTPTLPTGTIATTQTAGNSTTALATTAFVTTADNLKADLASPTFTGTPTLPTGTIATTQSANNNSTAVATTAYVDNQVNAYTLETKTASYTLVAGDKGKLIIMNSASANNLTIPASVFSAGATVSVLQLGAGQTTIVAGASTTVLSSGSKMKLYGQYAVATIVCTSSNTFALFGNIAT